MTPPPRPNLFPTSLCMGQLEKVRCGTQLLLQSYPPPPFPQTVAGMGVTARNWAAQSSAVPDH